MQPDIPIDLRSDTVTLPTETMREAMASAEVGDDARLLPDGSYGDPTIDRLQKLAANILGKEAALFVMSGTQANLIALKTWCDRGDDVAVGENSHIYAREKSGFDGQYLGLMPLLFDDYEGFPTVDNLNDICTDQNPKLLCLENTHNASCGTPWSSRESSLVVERARREGIPIHIDGARIFNAAVALETSVDELVRDVDSVMFCLTKGLGAPIGSVIAGSREFIDKARSVRKSLGGQWRQAGTAAAAGIEALKTGAQHIADDHQKAQHLASLLPSTLVNTELVKTNMIQMSLEGTDVTVEEIISKAAKKGLLLHSTAKNQIRLVTHRDLTESNIISASEIIKETLK